MTIANVLDRDRLLGVMCGLQGLMALPGMGAFFLSC